LIEQHRSGRTQGLTDKKESAITLKKVMAYGSEPERNSADTQTGDRPASLGMAIANAFTTLKKI